MKFTDIIALAKSGYTPADIREFMSAADDTKTDNKPAETVNDQKPESAPTGAEKTADTPSQDKPEKVEDPAGDDIESKYNALLKDMEDLKTKLAQAQQTNTKQNMQGEIIDAADIFNKAMMEFM